MQSNLKLFVGGDEYGNELWRRRDAGSDDG